MPSPLSLAALGQAAGRGVMLLFHLMAEALTSSFACYPTTQRRAGRAHVH